MDHWGGPWGSSSSSSSSDHSSKKDEEDKARRERYAKEYFSSSDPFADNNDQDTCLRVDNTYYTTKTYKVKQKIYSNNDHDKYTGGFGVGAWNISEGSNVNYEDFEDSPERTSSEYSPGGSYSDGSFTDSSSPGYSDSYNNSKYSDTYSSGLYSESYSPGYSETCPLECRDCIEPEYRSRNCPSQYDVCRDCGPTGYSECTDVCRAQCQCEEQYKVDGCCGNCGFDRVTYKPPPRVQITAKVLYGSVTEINALKAKKKSSKKEKGKK